MEKRNDRMLSFGQNAVRILVSAAFFTHGAQKLFGWFGGFGADGGTATLGSRYGAAAIIESIGGTLLFLGLFTRPVAFFLSGEMAVAYFWIHVPRGGPWWWANGGELAALYSWVFFLFFVWGAGSFSLDARLRER